MVIHVCYPKHCSALKLLPTKCKIQSNHHLVEEGAERKNAHTKDDMKESFALIISFHRDRILWNIIRPWIETRESKYLNAALRFIMKQFMECIYPISNEYELFCDMIQNEHYHVTKNGIDTDEQSSIDDNSHDWRCRDVNTINIASIRRNKRVDKKQKRNASEKFQLYIFFLPPYPSPLSNSTLYTEKLFTKALVKLENMQIRLQSLNAYVATLGGGYFLCRFLSTAISLANYQRRLALALGDYSLAMKCTINEAYNYIHAGMTKQANVLIKKTWKDAKQRNDALIISMCRSAKWFSDRVSEAQLREDEGLEDWKVAEKVSSDHRRTPTIDDYQRIRIVRNRDVKELVPKSR